jgi:hypothetical protein
MEACAEQKLTAHPGLTGLQAGRMNEALLKNNRCVALFVAVRHDQHQRLYPRGEPLGRCPSPHGADPDSF